MKRLGRRRSDPRKIAGWVRRYRRLAGDAPLQLTCGSRTRGPPDDVTYRAGGVPRRARRDRRPAAERRTRGLDSTPCWRPAPPPSRRSWG
ncbi:hypothetical protein HBB16_14460 [Pseudonocardia sp. MCCB 268]|nr:hypothetical protein [Pseudonocardia cytotoxica]